MKTEIKTNDDIYPVTIQYEDNMLYTECVGGSITYTKAEAIELRDFLNQLDLD